MPEESSVIRTLVLRRENIHEVQPEECGCSVVTDAGEYFIPLDTEQVAVLLDTQREFIRLPYKAKPMQGQPPTQGGLVCG